MTAMKIARIDVFQTGLRCAENEGRKAAGWGDQNPAVIIPRPAASRDDKMRRDPVATYGG